MKRREFFEKAGIGSAALLPAFSPALKSPKAVKGPGGGQDEHEHGHDGRHDDMDGPLVVANVDATCTATFVQRYTIAAVAGTGGSVTANSCPNATCIVDAGTNVTLTATPGVSYGFGGWTGAGCTPAGNNPLVLANVDATCTATFVRKLTSP